GAMQAQRIAMAVEGAVAAADHVGPEARQAGFQARAVDDLGLVAGDARLVVQALELPGAVFELCLGEREVEAPRPLEGDVEARLRLQACGGPAPRAGCAGG